MSDTASEASGKWRQGWPVVLAVGMAVSTAAVYCTGVFIAPLEQEFGWSRAEIASGLTLPSVTGVLFSAKAQ